VRIERLLRDMDIPPEEPEESDADDRDGRDE
jgi:hypothetical protein